MRFPYLVLIIFLITFNSVFSQKKDRHTITDLRIKWTIIENNYKSKPQSLSTLTFTALHKWSLPAKGWKIYFNFVEQVVPGTAVGNVNISHINGDLFCITPNQDFAGIKAGAALDIAFVSTGAVVNFTDAPSGFYLVWDTSPARCYALNSVVAHPSTQPKQYMRSTEDKVEISSPKLTYDQNRDIRDIAKDSLTKIFPTPYSYKATADKFILDANVKILANLAFTNEAAYLKKELAKVLEPSKKVNSANYTILLVKKPMVDEAYKLTVTNKAITIEASSGSGIFYGIQSLKTLIPPQAYHRKQKKIAVPGVIVSDKPRFGYRAIMLDIGRNFQPKKEVLKLLDLMSLYKFNIFHIHLTDDEGWRLEIPELPELTKIGSKRGFTLNELDNLQPSLGSGPFVNASSGSGYYCRADFIEILKYATERHISVIPEIESPGHARAAVKAMYARYKFYTATGDSTKAKQYLLNDLQDSSVYSSVQSYNDNVINVALPSTYRFIKTVTNAIIKIYSEAGAPLKTIHYGGDEVPAGVWEKSLAYANLKKNDTTIKSTNDLWPYYYKKVNNILKAHQLYLTAWEEAGTEKVSQNGKNVSIIDTGLNKQNVHLEVWNNLLGGGAEDLAYKLANNGYKVILSCVTNFYFDMAYNKSFDEPGYYWGGYAGLNKAFEFIPFDYLKNAKQNGMGTTINPSVFANKEKLTTDGRTNIIGLQGALWEETIKSTDRMEYMLLPRLLGLAERAWAKDPDWATETDTLKSKAMFNEAWSQFVNVLGKRELPRLDNYAGGFNYRIPNPGAIIQNGDVLSNIQIPGFIIRYTTNGQTPTLKSTAYKNRITNKGLIKLAVFNNTGRAGKTVSVINQ